MHQHIFEPKMSPLETENIMVPPRGYMSAGMRLQELNRRLQQKPEEADGMWWDSFVSEFFENDASFSISFFNEEGQKRYNISRLLIPKFYRSIYEGGASELYFVIKNHRELMGQSCATLECDNAVMVTQYNQPSFARILAEGRLVVEFGCDDLMRIRSWHQQIGRHREFIPRDIVAVHVQDPAAIDNITKNMTRQGLSNQTLNFLTCSAVLEPMQELMSYYKSSGMHPRDCLKATLYHNFNRFQNMMAPPSTAPHLIPSTKSGRQPKKTTKRSRKGSTNKETPVKLSKRAVPLSPVAPPQPPVPTSSSQDVMVVGEPVLMGGEVGDEDERRITRLENNKFDSEPGPQGQVNNDKDMKNESKVEAVTSSPTINEGPVSTPAAN